MTSFFSLAPPKHKRVVKSQTDASARSRLVRAHRVTRRPADAADLEARPTRHRRDDARESGPRSECKECGAGCANERDRPEEPSMTVPARLWRWNRLGLLLDGLRGVQRPHRKGDRLRRQGICRRRRGRNRRVGLVAGRRFLGQRQHGEHHERRGLPERYLVRKHRAAGHLRPLRRVYHSHEGGDGLRDARPQAGQVIYQS